MFFITSNSPLHIKSITVFIYISIVGCRKYDIRLSACSNQIQFESFLSWVESKISRLNSTNAHHCFLSMSSFTSASCVMEPVGIVGIGYTLGPQSYSSSPRLNLCLVMGKVSINITIYWYTAVSKCIDTFFSQRYVSIFSWLAESTPFNGHGLRWILIFIFWSSSIVYNSVNNFSKCSISIILLYFL